MYGPGRQQVIVRAVGRRAGLAAVAGVGDSVVRLERRFDVIECVGVLHHMEDPVAGWRVLRRLLEPGGYMKIGLYSERARRHIVAARAFLAARGDPPTPAGICCWTSRWR